MIEQKKVTDPTTKPNTRMADVLSIASLLTAMACYGVSAAEQAPFDKLSKQLNILNNIFVSSLKSQPGNTLKSTKVDNLYLAGQGAVFTVKASDGFAWREYGFDFEFADTVAPVAPVSPRPPENSEMTFEFFDDNQELVVQIEEAYEQQREFSRQFRDQQRDLGYELRDLERESRDLAYQLRNVSKEEQKALVKEQQSIKAKKAALEEKQALLSKKSKEMKNQIRINQEKKLAQRKAQYNKLTTVLIETLCTYGNSLKALPNDEFVTLVVKSAGSKVNGYYQDKIYVIEKKNVSKCSVDKISVEKLQASAKNYQY